MISSSENSIAESGQSEDEGHLHVGQVDGVSVQVVGLHVVHEGEEDGITVAQHPAEVVVGNVDRAQVPVFIVEEVDDIGSLEEIDEDHAIGDIAVLLVLGAKEGEVDEGPSNDAGSAVVEQLEVPELSETGVHFDSHEEVVDH